MINLEFDGEENYFTGSQLRKLKLINVDECKAPLSDSSVIGVTLIKHEAFFFFQSVLYMIYSKEILNYG